VHKKCNSNVTTPQTEQIVSVNPVPRELNLPVTHVLPLDYDALLTSTSKRRGQRDQAAVVRREGRTINWRGKRFPASSWVGYS